MDDAPLTRDAALRLLARREHSRLELARKLRARGHDPAAIDALLTALERENLLSDARFAELYARHRAERGYGPVRIRLELEGRGVVDGLIDAALAPLESEWPARIAQAREKKFGATPPPDLKERARQQRFLEYRGFSSEQIRAAFRYLEEQRPCVG